MTSRRWRVSAEDRNSLDSVTAAPQTRGVVELFADNDSQDRLAYVTWATEEDIETGGQFFKGERSGKTPQLCFKQWVYVPLYKTVEETLADIAEASEGLNPLTVPAVWRAHVMFREAGTLPMYTYWENKRENFCITVDLARRNVQYMIKAYTNLRAGGFMEMEQAEQWLLDKATKTAAYIAEAQTMKDNWETEMYCPGDETMIEIIEYVADRGGTTPGSFSQTLIYREMKAIESEIGADVDRWSAVAAKFQPPAEEDDNKKKKRRRRLDT